MPENRYNSEYTPRNGQGTNAPRRSTSTGGAGVNPQYRSTTGTNAPRRSTSTGGAGVNPQYRSTTGANAPRRSTSTGSAGVNPQYRSTTGANAPRRSTSTGGAGVNPQYRNTSAPQRAPVQQRPGTTDPAFRPAQRPTSGTASVPPRRPTQPRPTGGNQNGGYNGQNRIYQNQGGRAKAAPVRRPAAPQNNTFNQARQTGRQLSPNTKNLLGVLSAALMIVLCVVITASIRAKQPQPTIAMNTPLPDHIVQTNETPVPNNVFNPQSTNAYVNATTPQPTVATPATTANPVPSGSGRSVTIRAIGDVIIDTDTLELCKVGKDTYNFDSLFSMAADVMSDADWTMINIEATLRKHSKYGYMGYPQFRTPPSILDTLKACGVDMLTMCNNHALDGYFDGLKDSINYAEAAGLKHVGAYRTQEEYDTPEVYDLNGIKVGMLNYTQYTNGMAELSDKNASIYGMRLMSKANYARDISNLKSAGAEYVVAIMHWGEEYKRYPEAETKQVAKKLIAAGADLVIGGHPHVVQPAEYITTTDANGVSRTGLVIYSIGNFLSEHRHENAAYTDNGVIFEFTLQENAYGQIELVSPACIPVYVWQIDLGGGKYDYRVLPSGQYLNSAPAGMSASQHQRLQQSWNEIVELMNGVVPVIAQ